MSEAIYYMLYCGACITVLKEMNTIVGEPYMDEPFHVPQAQAYCRGELSTWDPKITTPPGLYVMSLLLKRVFMFKCTLPMLRLTTVLALLSLPLVLTRLICFHKRIRPPVSLLTPTTEAIIVGAFPIAWFFGFLYYTEAPSLAFVVWTVVAASQDRHWLAALLGLISCTFRQTNIVWLLYAYGSSQLMYLRFRRVAPGETPPKKLHDPPALSAGPGDLVRSVLSIPGVVVDILPSLVPYTLVLVLFGCFVLWNGGIVLGDKANHVPAFHVPQMYYFIAFATAFGWPVLITGAGGPRRLVGDVWDRMFGSRQRTSATMLVSIVMAITVKLFTIHHPFLLSDNRHYTFYVWRRVYMLHSVVPYVLIPVYIGCGWAWFLRVGREQTLLQTLMLPMLAVPTLLPTPLLEPRYFLIPYVLVRAQVSDVTMLGLVMEGCWYGVINGVTMFVFLYKARGEIRFMW